MLRNLPHPLLVLLDPVPRIEIVRFFVQSWLISSGLKWHPSSSTLQGRPVFIGDLGAGGAGGADDADDADPEGLLLESI